MIPILYDLHIWGFYPLHKTRPTSLGWARQKTKKSTSFRGAFPNKNSVVFNVLAIHAATAVDDLTRDIRGEVGGEEERHVGDVLGGATATQRNQALPSLADIVRQSVGHGRDDESRSDGIVTDVTNAHLLGRTLGEADDARLRGGVVALVGIARYAHHGAHVDDTAAVLLPHDGLHRLGEVEHRLEVDVDNGVPLLLGHTLEGGVFGDASVVDQHVDATEVLDDLFDNLLGLSEVGGVGGIGFGLDAHGLEFLFGFQHEVAQGDVGKGDVAALLGETDGDGLADAATGAGNQSHLVF